MTSSLSQQLQEWFAANARRLPWRTQPTVYARVVSEFMLQQTQVDTVLPYFERWMERFPDFQTLAHTPMESVLPLWEGLGYYARVRNLHALSQRISERPAIPSTYAEWLALPGIGPYTAAAVTSMAFGEAKAVVDGNVIRVLARLMGVEIAFKNTNEAQKTIQPIADSLLDPLHPGVHNEALMELGALICTKHTPKCELCPWKSDCLALENETVGMIPRLERKPTINREMHRLLWIQNEAILLFKADASSKRLAHLYEFPELSHVGLAQTANLKRITTQSRGISNERIKEFFYAMPNTYAATPSDGRLHWIALKDITHIPLSGPHRKAWNRIAPSLDI
jgi:A/G-specific adenine glycosylase